MPITLSSLEVFNALENYDKQKTEKFEQLCKDKAVFTNFSERPVKKIKRNDEVSR